MKLVNILNWPSKKLKALWFLPYLNICQGDPGSSLQSKSYLCNKM